ncbi:unnamed protein product [Caenorhabditis brenneri]
MHQGTEKALRIEKCVKAPEKRKGLRNAQRHLNRVKSRKLRLGTKNTHCVQLCVRTRKLCQGIRIASRHQTMVRIEKCAKCIEKCAKTPESRQGTAIAQRYRNCVRRLIFGSISVARRDASVLTQFS